MTTQNANKKSKENEEEWKRRVNKLGDAYFKACRRIASAISRISRDRENKG